MGLAYADLTLTNMFSRKKLDVRALVDTGAVHMCVTQAQARQLGFDLDECVTQLVRRTDGRQIAAPKIRPVEIAFGDRSYATEALVLGDEALMGVLPLEAMDLVIDPRGQKVTVNPEHPNYPVTLAK